MRVSVVHFGVNEDNMRMGWLFQFPVEPKDATLLLDSSRPIHAQLAQDPPANRFTES